LKLRQHKYFSVGLFIVLYLGLSFGNELFIGLTAKGNLYSPFLDEHLNYVKAFRRFLLLMAGEFIGLFGHSTSVYDLGLKMDTGRGVRLVYSCLGLSILSFWWAMILAFPQSLKNKIIFFFGGTALIVLLNIMRIAAVALVYNSWPKTEVDHHLLFNIVVYGILFLLLYRWFNLPQVRRQEAVDINEKEERR